MYSAIKVLTRVPKDLGAHGYVLDGQVAKCHKITPAYAKWKQMTYAGFVALSGLYHVEVRYGTCMFQCFNVRKAIAVGTKVALPHFRDDVPGFGRVVALVIPKPKPKKNNS